jgi:hypothetical protein
MLSGVYRFPQMESVVFGKPFAEALAGGRPARRPLRLRPGERSARQSLCRALRQDWRAYAA